MIHRPCYSDYILFVLGDKLIRITKKFLLTPDERELLPAGKAGRI